MGKLFKIIIRRLPAVMVLALVLVGVWFWRTASAPAVGVIESRQSAPDQVPEPVFKAQNGKLIEFAYPDSFRIKTTDAADKPNPHENYLLTAANSVVDPTHIAVSVEQTPIKITDSSAYSFRKQSADYKSEILSETYGQVYVFTKHQGSYEKTAFFSHGSYVATISITSPIDAADNPTLTKMLDSVKWKL